MTWMISPEETWDPVYHIVPVNDLKEHETGATLCKCKPTIKDGGQLVIHNSWDGREFFESDSLPEIPNGH